MNDLYIDALRQLAESHRTRITAYVKHSGEKGRMHEQIISDIIRSMCPKRYSIGTGFLINSFQDLSAQCDLVVFDEFFNRPLFPEMSVNVFPIECVYATLEVKATITRDNFAKSVDDILKSRNMAKRGKFYRSETLTAMYGEYTMVPSTVVSHLAPRSFIVGFKSHDLPRDKDRLLKYLRDVCDEEHKHFHGFLLLDENIFVRRRPYSNPAEFDLDNDNALLAFFRTFLTTIRDLPMTSMDIARYLESRAEDDKPSPAA